MEKSQSASNTEIQTLPDHPPFWKRNGLKPHRQSSFKFARDPRFEDKLLDVVGLYLNPPERALVLSCDEKSLIQTLNRTQPFGAGAHVHRRSAQPELIDSAGPAVLSRAVGQRTLRCSGPRRSSIWISGSLIGAAPVGWRALSRSHIG